MNEMIVSVSHNELENNVKAAYDANVPLMVWGAPGIGKSQVIRKAAEDRSKEEGRQFVDWNAAPEAQRRELETSVSNKEKFIYCDIRLSQYDPSDFALPWAKDGAMVWVPSGVLLAFSRPETKGLLFLDELPQAMPAVQNAAYQIILDRGYKDVCFPDIRVVAAGNRSMDGGSQFAFPPALANRLAHIELETPDGKAWATKWATKNGIHELVIAFIMHDPSQIYEQSGKIENRRFAHATPRSWESASKLLKTLPPFNESHLEDWTERARVLVYQTVGRAAAIDFVSFLEVMRGVDMKDVFAHPEKVNELSLDQQLGLFALIEANLTSTRKKCEADGDTEFKAYTKMLCPALDVLTALKRKEFTYFLLTSISRSRRPDHGFIPNLLKKASKKHMEIYIETMTAFAQSMA